MVEYTHTTPNTPRNRGDYEAPHMSPVLPSEDLRTILINRVAWGSVFSGVVIALTAQFLLNLLGVGVGFVAMNNYGMTDLTAESLSIGALSWWIISGVIAAGIGGFAAGRLSGEPRESTAGWHGLTAWAMSVLVLIGLVIGGAGALVGGTLQVTGMGGTISVRNMDNSALAVSTSPSATEDTVGTTEGATNATTGTRTEGGVTTIDAGVLSRGALACFVALLLGAIAAWFGGVAGTVKPTITALNSSATRRQLH